MPILLMIHSILRWVIMLVAVVAIIVFLVSWLRKSHLEGVDRGLMSGFSGLMDLQATIGIVLLLWGGFGGIGFPAYRIEHGVTMVIAAAVAHMSVRWKNADDSIRYRNYLFLILASLVLVFIGISFLPGGLSR
ncbi:MAG: hypothetical protein ACM3XO_05290 [Bacteroidota bacterium]|jgi:hypothetical protein